MGVRVFLIVNLRLVIPFYYSPGGYKVLAELIKNLKKIEGTGSRFVFNEVVKASEQILDGRMR